MSINGDTDKIESNLINKTAHSKTERHQAVSLFALSAFWLFPGIVISMVLVNQPWELAVLIGQFIGWLNILSAALIVYNVTRHKRWLLMLSACIIISKTARIIYPSSTFALISYITFLNILFCYAGAVMVSQRPQLIYKQVMIICLMNLIFMAMQVSGAGAWTQVFTTHGEGNLTEPVSTLFVPEDELEYQIVQGRPAGLSYSNIILSLIIVFGALVHFTGMKEKLWWGTPLLCSMVVLSMSKFVFLGFTLIILWLIIAAKRKLKLMAIKALAAIVVLLCLYMVLFPGLAATNLSHSTISTSFYLRANEIVGVLDQDSFIRNMLEEYLKDTPRASWVQEGEFVSGYAQVIKKIPALIPILMMAALIFILGFRKLSKRFPELNTQMVLTILIFGAYPFTFPIWQLQMYWFMIGIGLLPLMNLLRPRFIEM